MRAVAAVARSACERRGQEPEIPGAGLAVTTATLCRGPKEQLRQQAALKTTEKDHRLHGSSLRHAVDAEEDRASQPVFRSRGGHYVARRQPRGQ
ncbi:hypothetical protein NDU88_003515 [Pleurodeles waltl]|uniref:Uncharacterized protein n=1 Tax=Pleurodeles waltl TaxID=8319 RepID=A0AAV7SFB6_PLEWA|nr:hypothetical protein NDU88_003515 [Pleurodeles waltl]